MFSMDAFFTKRKRLFRLLAPAQKLLFAAVSEHLDELEQRGHTNWFAGPFKIRICVRTSNRKKGLIELHALLNDPRVVLRKGVLGAADHFLGNSGRIVGWLLCVDLMPFSAAARGHLTIGADRLALTEIKVEMLFVPRGTKAPALA